MSELLSNTPEVVAIMHTMMDIITIAPSRLVHCRAAVPGAITRALVRMTPTDWSPIIMVSTMSPIKIVSNSMAGRPMLWLNE